MNNVPKKFAKLLVSVVCFRSLWFLKMRVQAGKLMTS